MRQRELLVELHNYFTDIENPSNEEKIFRRDIGNSLEYFPVTYLHREDLEYRGLSAEDISDVDMQNLASKLGDAYVDSSDFWADIDILAPKYFEQEETEH